MPPDAKRLRNECMRISHSLLLGLCRGEEFVNMATEITMKAYIYNGFIAAIQPHDMEEMRAQRATPIGLMQHSNKEQSFIIACEWPIQACLRNTPRFRSRRPFIKEFKR
jgi:hypothetical protein